MSVFGHEYFMRKALNEAQIAYQKDEVPVGAVIVYENKIIAKAHNLCEQLIDFTAHAEMQAMTSASNFLQNKYLNECSLYVTLEPCVMCLGAIFNARISKLIFGAYDQKTGACGSATSLDNNKDLNHHCTSVNGGILEKQSLELLQNFFKNKR